MISLISILSFFKIFLPFEIARGVNFSPTGITFSVVSMMLLLLPLTLISTINKNKLLPQPLALTVTILFTLTVALTGSFVSYILLALIFLGSVYASKQQFNKGSVMYLLTPVIIAVLVIMLTNISFSGNKLWELRNNFPKEIQLPLGISWKVAASAFRDAPFFGTGPSTFLYNFTSYKPVEFNQQKYWNFSFASANNEILQVLGTLGLLGFFALIVICGGIFISSRRYLSPKQVDYSQDELYSILPGFALSGIIALVLLLTHVSTLISLTSTFILMAAFMASQKEVRERLSEFSTGVKISTFDSKQIDFLAIIILIVYLVGAVFVSQKTYKFVLADYYHRLALSQANKDGAKTYEYLQKAEDLNPYIDLYRIDMAQTNFALANALASQKGPTDKNPEGTLTDQDKQTIQTLVTQAINEGRASVVLNPRSSRNWEVLALIYRNITGVAKNSLTFSLDAYGRSIQMDPLNPNLRVNVGSIYHLSKNYDLAVRFYTDSINLKPDYVNGYYNLALAYKDKGDLQNAKIVAEQALALLQKDIGSREYVDSTAEVKATKNRDFNTVNDLLNEINGQIDTNKETETEAPQEGALQNPNLPSIDVGELNNPPETTPPPAVEENPQVNLPEVNPTTAPVPAL